MVTPDIPVPPVHMVDPGLRKMPGLPGDYLDCRLYRATIPIGTCLKRRDAGHPGIHYTYNWEACVACDQGAAVAHWAEEQGIEAETKGGGKVGKLKKGTCENCSRDQLIKARGCCRTCYDTPFSKGYKPGSKEWITCQTELRERLNPLFKPGKVPDNKGAQEAKQEGSPVVESGTGAVVDTRPGPRLVVNNAEPSGHKGLARELIEKDENRTRAVPAGSFTIGGPLAAWLDVRAAVNRRTRGNEILFILENECNREAQRRDAEKRLAEMKYEPYRQNAPQGSVLITGWRAWAAMNIGWVVGGGWLVFLVICIAFLKR